MIICAGIKEGKDRLVAWWVWREAAAATRSDAAIAKIQRQWALAKLVRHRDVK